MLDFSPITDERLHRLAMVSTAIASLPEAQAIDLIARMGAATVEQQARLAGVLEEAQVGFDAIAQQQLDQINAQISKMQDLITRLKELEHEYDRSILKFSEVKSRAEEEQVQQQLMDQLNTIS